jgi:putative ABC transport system substrate-binding protein
MVPLFVFTVLITLTLAAQGCHLAIHLVRDRHQDKPRPEQQAKQRHSFLLILAEGGLICLIMGVLQQTTKTIPIVAIVSDMLGSGLVTSLARPEGNTTGVSILTPEADGKRQDILIEVVPGLRLMAVLADVKYASTARLDELRKAAAVHNIEFSIHRVARGEEIAAAIDSAPASGAKALNTIASPLFYGNRHLIMERTVAAHLPTIYEFPETAEEGGFAGYGPRQFALEELLALKAVELFRGSKVADIPVEQPTKFELVINLKTAKAMGVTVPESLLVRADKVIE